MGFEVSGSLTSRQGNRFVFLCNISVMQTKRPFSPTEAQIARYAKALSHPARVFILKFLDQHCACYAGDISEQLPMANSTVSQHLKALKAAGLIQGAIHPPTIEYCINKEAWQEAKALFQDFFTECC